MANICMCTLTITGDQAQRDDFWKRFQDQEDSMLKAYEHLTINDGGYGACMGYATYEDDKIMIPIDSKWGPPENLKEITEMFPKLHFLMTFEEPQMNIFGTVNATDGVVNVEDMECEAFQEKYNEAYKEEKGILKNDPWEEIKNYEFSFDHAQYAPWDKLETLFVKRIPYEELPVYMNEEFWSDSANELLKSRLAAGK